MSYKENTLKLKKLLFKLKYLYAELDECNYTFDKCKVNFSLEFQKKIGKLKKKEKNVIKKADKQIKKSIFDNKKLDKYPSPKSFKNLPSTLAEKRHKTLLWRIKTENKKLFNKNVKNASTKEKGKL